VGLTNQVFTLDAQYTQLSTNGSFANPNQPGLTQLKSGGTNLNYQLILWRSSALADALAWVPAVTNLISGTTYNFLLSTNGPLADLNASADHYFYTVTPYFP
jgi:hypothetical protein